MKLVCKTCKQVTEFDKPPLYMFEAPTNRKLICQVCYKAWYWYYDAMYLILDVYHAIDYLNDPKSHANEKCRFGRYSDKSLEEVCANHPTYLTKFIAHNIEPNSCSGFKHLFMYYLSYLPLEQRDVILKNRVRALENYNTVSSVR